MKKIVIFSFLMVGSMQLVGNTAQEQDTRFSTAFSAGYVFKNDCLFKDVYGHGIVDIITADGCYYPWKSWGFGATLSYWRAHGETTFLHQPTLLQEIPATVYVRGKKDFCCGLQLCASLGGGFLWLKEKSYLGALRLNKGIGQVEVNLNYHVWRCLDIVSAFRYLFPNQSSCSGADAAVRGFDLRGGIGFTF